MYLLLFRHIETARLNYIVDDIEFIIHRFSIMSHELPMAVYHDSPMLTSAPIWQLLKSDI